MFMYISTPPAAFMLATSTRAASSVTSPLACASPLAAWGLVCLLGLVAHKRR